MGAAYVSGSGTNTFTYRYTVGYNNYDADGVAFVSPLNRGTSTLTATNGGANANLTFTPPSAATIKIDGRVPTIQSNTSPANGTYTSGQNLDFSITYNRNVTVTGNPRVRFNSGYVPSEVETYADYLSGSGSATLNFRYTVKSTDDDLDGVFLNVWMEMRQGSIIDDVGNGGRSRPRSTGPHE